MIHVHVSPNPSGPGWAVKRSGRVRPASAHTRKAPAVNAGRRLAKQLAREHPRTSVELVIHRRDGRIHRKHSMGSDPRNIKG